MPPAEADGEGETAADADGDAEADALGAGDADAAGEPDGEAAGDPEADDDAEGAGEALGAGCSTSPMSASVLIRTYCRSPDVVIATMPSRPSSLRTWRTSAGVGCCGRSKCSSMTVPPVKSIENFSPSWPPVRNVRAMKIRPGTVISAL